MDTHGSADRAGQRALTDRSQCLPLLVSGEFLIGFDDKIARWVGEQVGIDDFGPCRALGIMRGPELVAGIVYNNFREANIEATIASVTPRWCSRRVLHAVFWYPFVQLGMIRLTAITESTNESVRAFLCRLGFQEEGVMRRGFRSGADAAVYGMLREECRWLER
jgi:RimJ/RimL family protein N-acetyltransferase